MSVINHHFTDSTTYIEMAASQETSSFDITGAMNANLPQTRYNVARMVGFRC